MWSHSIEEKIMQTQQQLKRDQGKVSQILQRKDGSEVKIVAEEFFGAGLRRSVGVFVLRRASPMDDWRLCSDQPHPDWRSMSVDEYQRHGRSEMLQTVTWGEIFRVTNALAH